MPAHPMLRVPLVLALVVTVSAFPVHDAFTGKASKSLAEPDVLSQAGTLTVDCELRFVDIDAPEKDAENLTSTAANHETIEFVECTEVATGKIYNLEDTKGIDGFDGAHSLDVGDVATVTFTTTTRYLKPMACPLSSSYPRVRNDGLHTPSPAAP